MIELDGDTHGGVKPTTRRGHALEARLPSDPVHERDVMTNLDGVLRTILIALGATLDPSPPSGRG